MAGAHGSQISRDLQWGDSTGFGAGSQHLGHAPYRVGSCCTGSGLLARCWPFAPAHLTSGQPMCNVPATSIAGCPLQSPNSRTAAFVWWLIHLHTVCLFSFCLASAWLCGAQSGRGPCLGDLRVTVTAAPSPCSVPLRPFMTLLFLLLSLPLVQTLGDRPP